MDVDLIEFSDDSLEYESEQESYISPSADEAVDHQAIDNPSLGDTLKETLRDAPTKTHKWMADKVHHTVRYENFTFSVTCQHGSSDSINEDSIHELRTWHEFYPNLCPPVSQKPFNFSKGLCTSNRKYYGENYNELEMSIFQIFVSSTEPGAEGHSMLYSLQVLHKPGQRGEPVHVTWWHKKNSKEVAWAFGWNSKKKNFNERPLALLMTVKAGESEGEKLARVKAFEACSFDMSRQKHWPHIRKILSRRARGWSGVRLKNTQRTRLSDAKLTATEAAPPRPNQGAKRKQDSSTVDESSNENMEKVPKLLTSMRVRLVSEDGEQARVFLLEGCDSKTFFDKAREFFGVTDPSKELSVVCGVPGMEHQRYIGENCGDEFDIFFHDVQKLCKVAARQDDIEITVRPVICERK